jgi:hypothetical protein
MRCATERSRLCSLATPERREMMAQYGMTWLDSDRYIVEPLDLEERYTDSAFKERAPKGIPLVKTREGELKTPK